MARTTSLSKFKKRLVTQVGELEYTHEDVFFFKNGIYGFENLKDFIVTVLPYEHTPEIYRYLQSTEASDLALIIMNIVINSSGTSGTGIIELKDLEPHLQARDLKLEDVAIFLVTSIHNEEDRQRVSVNTKAPIILAPGRQEGWQIILDSPDYQVKHYLV